MNFNLFEDKVTNNNPNVQKRVMDYVKQTTQIIKKNIVQ